MVGNGTGLAGVGGASRGGSCFTGSLDRSLAFGLRGSVGTLDSGRTSVVVILGVDFVPFKGILVIDSSFFCCDLFGGKGGNDDGS